MYEAITLVKVRQATVLKVPAGGWVCLLNPDQPLHEHIAARNKLVEKGNVNDDYSRLIVGRLQDATLPAQFITSGEAAQIQVHIENTSRQLQEQNAQVKQLQMQKEKDAEALHQKEHQARVAELNREHAAIRATVEGRTAAAVRPVIPKVELTTDAEAIAADKAAADKAAADKAAADKATASAHRRSELLMLKRSELLVLAEKLKAESGNGNKVALVNGILLAEGLTVTPNEAAEAAGGGTGDE